MASFNKVILLGRLTAQPELKQTQSGTAVTSFTIAVDRRYSKEGQEKQADFITVVAWKRTAEFICKYFGKGSAILVCGELQTRSWEQDGQKRYATEVVASEVSFCEAKKSSEGNNSPQQQNAVQSEFGASTQGYGYNPYAAPQMEAVKNDDDLPF